MRASQRIAMFAVASIVFLPASRAQNDAAAQKEPAPPPSVTVIGARDAHGVLGRDVRSPTNEDMGHIVDVIVDRTGTVRQACAQPVMRLKIALHPSTAVEVRDHRSHGRIDVRGVVDPPRNRARGSGNGDMLDAREVGRRLVHQVHHRPELLPQLPHRGMVAAVPGAPVRVLHLGVGRIGRPARPSGVFRYENCLDEFVEPVQVNIGQDRGGHPALRTAAQRGVPFPVLKVPGLQHIPQQPQEPVIVNLLAQYPEKYPVIKRSETVGNISLDEPGRPGPGFCHMS